MAFDAHGPHVWPIAPDWSDGMREQLAWSTEILTASATAVTTHRGLWDGPRRRFTFDLLDANREFRLARMLLAGHGGLWLLPIWPDQQWLTTTVWPESTTVACRTEGFDFVEGGQVLLYTDAQQWEVAEVAQILPAGLELAAPVLGSYGRGARLFPLRLAHAEQGARTRFQNARTARVSLAFDIAEPCDWPALDSLPTYRDHPVIDTRPNEDDDATASAARAMASVDYGTGLPFVHDITGVSLRQQSHHWLLHGRADHARFRSLLYLLDGSRVPVWVPSWASDLAAAAPIVGNSTTLTVQYAGYTQFGLGQPSRRDLSIELVDGTVYRRRVTGAAHVGDVEVLTLDSALAGSTITPGRIRDISFLSLCTLASDTVQIDHINDQDGLAKASTAWQGVVPDA